MNFFSLNQINNKIYFNSHVFAVARIRHLGAFVIFHWANLGHLGGPDQIDGGDGKIKMF